MLRNARVRRDDHRCHWVTAPTVYSKANNKCK